MTRSLSTPAKRAMHAPQTGEVFLALLTIEHADLASPLRFVNNMTDVVSNGNTYTAYPFTIELPEQTGERPAEIRLVIDNVMRTITDAILDLSPAPTVSVQLVLASSPNTVELATSAMTLRDVVADAFTVSGVLATESFADEPYPGHTFNPVDWPGLF